MLRVTRKTLKYNGLSPDLDGLRLAFLTDLHFGSGFGIRHSDAYLKSIRDAVYDFVPDLVLYGGDYICCSELKEADRMREFFSSIRGAYGAFGVLGNHDYAKWVTLLSSGYTGICEKKRSLEGFLRLAKKVAKKLFLPLPSYKGPNDDVKKVGRHGSLEALLRDSGIRVLENEACDITVGKSVLRLWGSGEYWAGRFSPSPPSDVFCIALVHNPDAIDDCKEDLILCGHTHGGQINIPFLWQKFTAMQKPQYKTGLFGFQGRFAYVSRGLGACVPLRIFASPELVFITLRREYGN